MCCADEAALCVACDEEVHAANKLAGKRQRVPLLTDADAAGTAATANAAPAMPKCDICQLKCENCFYHSESPPTSPSASKSTCPKDTSPLTSSRSAISNGSV